MFSACHFVLPSCSFILDLVHGLEIVSSISSVYCDSIFRIRGKHDSSSHEWSVCFSCGRDRRKPSPHVDEARQGENVLARNKLDTKHDVASRSKLKSVVEKDLKYLDAQLDLSSPPIDNNYALDSSSSDEDYHAPQPHYYIKTYRGYPLVSRIHTYDGRPASRAEVERIFPVAVRRSKAL